MEFQPGNGYKEKKEERSLLVICERKEVLMEGRLKGNGKEEGKKGWN